jgi:dipeptide transport system ATP-binding protein
MSSVEPTNGDRPLVEIRSLKKYFPIKKGILQREVARVHAVDDLSLTVQRGETLGLVGESGCGKSTLGRCIVRLLDPTAGDIIFEGQSIAKLKPGKLRPLRRQLQMIFQDPYASLNPRKRVGTIISDPLRIHDIGDKAERKRRVQELLETVGLSPEHYNRFPHEFSGGQRQRIGVARALALRPKLIVADEPVSALDVSIQAQVLNLLADLQAELGLAYLFISHDLGVVRHIAHDVLVMYLGHAIEQGPKERIFARALHPYTQALLASTPGITGVRRKRIVLKGELPSPLNPPKGCVFSTRCPYVTDRCRVERPPLRPLDGRLVACHYAERFLAAEAA